MRVTTELGIKGRPVIHSLGRALREDSEPLRILALRGLMKLGASDVVDLVIPLILEPGELREHALSVVVAIGESAIRPLKALYPNADFHGKRAIATALARVGTAKGVDFLLENLLAEPFELQKHLGLCLCEAIDNLPPKDQRPIFNLVKKFSSLPRVRKDLQSQVVCLILLGHFRHEKDVLAARKILKNYAQRKHTAEVRRYAMVSLARSIMEAPVDVELTNFLKRCLCDDDWHNVAQHALSAFQRLELPRAANLKLVSLLRDSPHFSVHIHVFERLTRENRPEVAKAILPFLRDSRYRVRDAAEKALRSMPAAIGDLFSVLSDTVDTDLSHRLHAIVRDYPQDVKRKYLDRAINRFMTLHERNDRRAQFFLDLVRSIDPEPLRRKIYQKVESLRRSRSKDRWLKISRYLEVLWDHHLITAEGRYTFAVALIRQSSKDLSPHARRANLGLQVMRALIYDDTPGLVANLTKSKDLKPEDLFYIGFHFMEEGDELRPFARALLEYLVKKSPSSKIGRAASQKLGLHERLEAETAATPRRAGAGRLPAAARVRAARARKSAASPVTGQTAKKTAKKTAKSTGKRTAEKPRTAARSAPTRKKTAKKPTKKSAARARRSAAKASRSSKAPARSKSRRPSTAARKKSKKSGAKKTSRKRHKGRQRHR